MKITSISIFLHWLLLLPPIPVNKLSQGNTRMEIKTNNLVVGRDESDMLQSGNRDKISNLPEDLILCILNRLSINDAARTSVLAKEWRYFWGNNTQLVLDRIFFVRLTCNEETDPNQFVFLRALESIFLSHIGLILSFKLYIPPDTDLCSVTRWIEHFLKKGVEMRCLELDNYENNACEIPSCLFDCGELICLALNTWILNSPHKCTTFTNLTWVKLINISFSADISFGTQLKHLISVKCTGIKHLGSQFTNGNSLTNVHLEVTEQIDWRWFEYTTQLRSLGLIFYFPAAFNIINPINFIKLLRNVPTIKSLTTSGFSFQVNYLYKSS